MGPPHRRMAARHWALQSLGPASSLGPPHRRRALRIVDGPSASSHGPPHLRLARRVLDWLATSSIGPLGGRLACRVVDWLAVWSIGPPCSRLAHRVVDWPVMWWGSRVVLQLASSLENPLCGALRWAGVGVSRIEGGRNWSVVVWYR
jgi:hypothetical protein